MKKFFLLTFLTVFCVGLSLSAQNRRQRAEQPVYPSEELIQQVQLSEDQVSELKVNEEAYREAMQQLVSKRGVDRDSLQTRLKAVRKERLEGVKKVLSSEQYVAYLEYEVVNPSGFGGFPSRNEAAPRRDNDGDGFGPGGDGGFGGGMDDF